jgi:uncharacterized protein (DUF983 family)
MSASMNCPRCGSKAIFHSRWRRGDGLLRPLLFAAFRCHACGHRHFRIDAVAVAVVAAVLLTSAMLIGVGEVVWTRHAQQRSSPIAQAQAVVGDA